MKCCKFQRIKKFLSIFLKVGLLLLVLMSVGMLFHAVVEINIVLKADLLLTPVTIAQYH